MSPLDDYYKQISVPANNGREVAGLRYPGFADGVDYLVSPGEALWLPLQTGDLISCVPVPQMRLAALDLATGRECIAALLNGKENGEEVARAPLQARDYDDRTIAARLAGMGLSHEALVFYQFGAAANEADGADGVANGAVVWESRADLILIVVLPENNAALVNGTAGSALALQHRPARASAVLNERKLPPPLGKVLDEFTIRRGSAQSYEIPRGAYVQIMDVEGRQCSDFMAFNAKALDAGKEKHIDSTVSRTFARGAYPRPGLFNKFYDGDITPLLEVVQDTIGRHDTFALACTARGYEERGFPGHVNCSDNISQALDRYGIAARPAWPAINFFFNSWILPQDNQLQSDEAWSRPGDYVLMKALTDLVAVSTACPDDIDPINGWNPTDIHVRLYAPDNVIKPAIAYRTTPNEPANMTTESPFHRCTSRLTGKYEPHLDYWVPQYYEPHGALEEYWKCRESAVMQDMSNLRIYDVCGSDALRFLQTVLTRDVSRISLNKGKYALICDESGSVLDDGTLFNIGENIYRWTCSSNESLLHLKQVAEAQKAHVFIRDMSRTLCTLAVQGPLSHEILREILFIQPTQPTFDHLRWFGGAVARLHDRTGVPLYVSRTGYTGERGYELFCDHRDAEAVWEAVAAAGGERIMPMGAQALNLLRVEAGLMARGSEFGNMEDAYEAGLGFAVEESKGEFIGAAALQRNRAAPRRRLVGLVLEGSEVAHHGDGVYQQRHLVGRVTSAVFSPMLQKSIAMAVVNVEHSADATALEVGKLDGHAKRLPAAVTGVPFVDAERKRPRGA